MKLERFRDNPDGSADFLIEDLTPEETEALVRLGLIRAIEAGIKEAQEKFTPKEDFTDESSTTVGGTD
jgi:hypothetical protein